LLKVKKTRPQLFIKISGTLEIDGSNPPSRRFTAMADMIFKKAIYSRRRQASGRARRSLSEVWEIVHSIIVGVFQQIMNVQYL
jgi:hypothetical protein